MLETEFVGYEYNYIRESFQNEFIIRLTVK